MRFLRTAIVAIFRAAFPSFCRWDEPRIAKMESSIETLIQRSHEDRDTHKATENHLCKIEALHHKNTGMLEVLLVALKIRLPSPADDKEPEV